MEKYDPSQLTEFPRFESEATQSGVSSFLNKIWKLPLFSQGETSDSKDKNVIKEKPEDQATSGEVDEQNYDDMKTETGTYAVEFEGRSLPNVLKRISSLIALGSGGGTRYADTELARYWMPDDISRECYECAARFSALRRRHHCRVCGQIFCSRCCSQRVPGQIFGCAGGLRVCNYCCNVVLSYLRENDMSGDMSPDLRTLQENLQAKFPDNKLSLTTSKESFMFAGSHSGGRETSRGAREGREGREELHEVFTRLAEGLPTQQHRYRLVRYNGVWRGCDILQWLMDNTDNKTRAQATQICQSLLKACYMECSTELQHFADYGLYKPISLPPPPEIETPTEDSPARLVESVSSYCLDLNLGESSARLTKAMRTEEVKASPVSEEENPILDQSEEATETRHECPATAESGREHLQLLARQVLARAALPPHWLRTLYPLCRRAADTIVLDMYANDIDVRNYVQVKKAPGGEPADSCLIPGVVMTKNVAHRGMPQELTNPTVLLLDCSIAYQRVEGKLTSLEPVLLQEQEYLIRCAARISALRPKVLLVRGTCARAVQDVLRNEGVALATGVGAAALARAARAARADIVTSIDARIGLPRLGTCGNFYVKNFSNKTLMVLENCAEPQLGCCILLRGASLEELARVKKVAKFITLACYNWKLERSFLCDTEAILPDPGMTFCNDDNENDGNENDGNDKVVTDNKNDENKMEIDTKNIEDPLNKAKSFRKTDSDKNLSCGVPIRDNSDPLRARQMSVDDEVFLPGKGGADTVLTAAADTDLDRWSTDDTVLSMSPNVRIPPPRGPLPARPPPTPRPPRDPATRPVPQNTLVTEELHPFVKEPITAPIDDLAVRAALAHFRATGCRIYKSKHSVNCPLYKPPAPVPLVPDATRSLQSSTEHEAPRDPLAPDQHQRLSLLLYSFSDKSPNVPDFCVNPWIATMEMYGTHDITLGAFLHKYCFSSDSRCPSSNCTIPMNQHVRRFVHEDVCLTITCNTIGHSNVDKVNDNQSKQVMFWTRCQSCGASGRGSRLSRRALSLSLAVYLSLRALAPRYLRRDAACRHAWHAHAHCFAVHAASATIKYSKIKTWDIELPPREISTKYDTREMRDALVTKVNDLVLRGHETFSSFTDSESDKDYQIFKQHVEQIHVALTSAALLENATSAGVVRSLWAVSDRILFAEKLRRDAQEKWSSPTKPNKPQPDTSDEKPIENEDLTTSDSGSVENSESAAKDETDRAGTEEDEDKGDKKTVRRIISQFLTNNQPSNQSGIIITGGSVPVEVAPGDAGALLAAALAAPACRLAATAQPVQEETETQNSKDKQEGEKSKAKPSEHVEVVLKEGLSCRVYYCQQFHRLRHALLARAPQPDTCDGKTLCDVEEGFIRSLAHCVPWAARGGKSGSTFCKTTDDRYVLKEMTRPEWQQFLEFAPHYFNYVYSCLQNNQPSLLARILGVFGAGAGGVLVAEHVFYGARADDRFDLKGSRRHRLAAPAPHAVLMDENLLNMRWQTQLYLQSHTAATLMSCIERDTTFLASHSVMDYSLLLGIDDGKLVLGLIDYIRTFTWDKKLEHYVKRNLGAGQPTVVSPAQYKARLIAAVKNYFPRAVGHWDHFTDSLND